MSEPMELHSMGPGEIALTTFRVYFRILPTMLGIGVILLGIILGASLLLGIINSLIHFVSEYIITALVFIIIFIATAYYYAAATLAVSLFLTGYKAGLFQVLRRVSATLIFQILATGVLVMLSILGGFILLVIPGIIFMTWFIFASPVVVLERMAYASAMKRSRELVKNHWWRIFLSILLVVVLIEIAIYGVSFILAIPLKTIGLEEWSFPIAHNVAILMLFPLQFIYPVLLYYDMRIRKEAMNIMTIREAL